MRILVITSCTGEKSVSSERALTLEDFKQGRRHVSRREKELKDLLCPAESLYTGQQHVRLMRGVQAFRESRLPTNGDDVLDLEILSAGYGIVSGETRLAPYEATFQGMPKGELREWARELGIPAAFRKTVAAPYDLGLILLGDDYLSTCELDGSVEFGGPTLIFCGGATRKRLPDLANVRPVVLSNPEAKRFSCGLVALKGELACRLLSRLAADAKFSSELWKAKDLLTLVQQQPVASTSRRRSAATKSDVDYVIDLPHSWQDKPHRKKLKYFIPEWDDQVDRDFDFENDEHSGGSGDWSNQVYAHQMYPEPNYDGLLISKVVAEKSKSKKERINRLGVHRFLRVPREFPIMGDCGAFGYINEDVPPYTTEEVLEYYTRLDFDFGVSLDHLIVTATEAKKKARYDLTIENAAAFLKQHRKAKLPWTPMGAVQGWDPKSYAAAAKKYVAMGYDYIGLGGLVRSSTPDIIEILRAVHDVVPSSVRMHLFGLARLNGLAVFTRLGVTSVDSASFLRQAWMRTTTSYVMPGESFAAIRIPEAGKSFRAKRMNEQAGLSDAAISQMEQNALRSVREYAARQGSLDAALNALLEYDRFVTADRVDLSGPYRNTLEKRPWELCGCEVCRQAGIEVVIFRGNNRNRRRGFHNTYVFYRLLDQALRGDTAGLPGRQLQLSLMEDEP
jgi:hypothetical protein